MAIIITTTAAGIDNGRHWSGGASDSRLRGMPENAADPVGPERCSVRLQLFGCAVEVCGPRRIVLDAVMPVYGALQSQERQDSTPLFCYSIECSADSGYRLQRRGSAPVDAAHLGELLYIFEKDLTIAVQHRRRDLYVLHSAGLELPQGGVLGLFGPSGAGKSTTAWALLHHGLGYLSDELLPVDPVSLDVHPYPRALLLKDLPPSPYELGDAPGVATPWNFHVPIESLPSRAVDAAQPLKALVFLSQRASSDAPCLQPLSRAQAAAHIYTCALNPLAHPESGLAVAADIARQIPAFSLRSGNLQATARLLLDEFASPPGLG